MFHNKEFIKDFLLPVIIVLILGISVLNRYDITRNTEIIKNWNTKQDTQLQQVIKEVDDLKNTLQPKK